MKFSANLRTNKNWKMTNIIYTIPCGYQNCDKQYVGMSPTSLQKRLEGHQSDINNINKQSIGKQHSANTS
jgi:hypothetical protein